MLAPGTKPTRFLFNKSNRDSLLTYKFKWNMPGLSEFTFYRTYARRKENGTLESFNDCVVRVIEGMFTILKTHCKTSHLLWDEKKAQKLAFEAAERMFQFKWLPPGRGLWMMGTDYVWERGGAALNNCAFVSTNRMGESVEETVLPFRFLMDMSMMGVGVGFDTLGAKNNVPILGYSDNVEKVVVEDTRESWVDVVVKSIENGIFGGPRVVPDVSLVRGEGVPIKGFGGVSSGPNPLIMVVNGIYDLINTKRGKNIDSILITDIQNLIGKCVVAGNVRRSAEIAFSDIDDNEFMEMKNWSRFPVETGSQAPDELKFVNEEDYMLYNKHLFTPQDGVCKSIQQKYINEIWYYKFGGWRWASNNSVAAKNGMDYTRFAASISEAGEPGFKWLDLMQKYGRMKEPANNKDYRVMGGNPCLEQSLESYELCCLVENFPSHADDYWDFQRTLKFSYLYAKAVTLMATHFDRTNQVMVRNRRIGCSMSGIQDNIAKVSRYDFFNNWCDNGYNYIQYIDKKYSEWLGIPQSIKSTSIKPSGTTSLVAGVFGPGMHWPKMRTGYRTIRVSNNSELLPILKAANYRVEASVTDPQYTSVIYFPWLTPDNLVSEDDVTIWEQFKMAADLQNYWADNQVSCTIGFTKQEADSGQIASCLSAFDGQIKGISLLPKAEGVYKQMPFTKAPREEVEQYVNQLKDVNFTILSIEGENSESNKFCDSDVCTI